MAVSSFQTKINELGYEICKKVNKEIIIQKYDELATIVIYFNGEEKQISGAIKTNKLIYTLNEISHQYSIFRTMEADLKTFKQLSGYDIIN